MLVLPLGIKENHLDFLEGQGRRVFLEERVLVLSPNPAVREPRARVLFFPIRSTPADVEGLYRLPKHSERLGLVQ